MKISRGGSCWGLILLLAIAHAQPSAIRAQQTEDNANFEALTRRLQAAEQRIAELESGEAFATQSSKDSTVRQTQYVPNAISYEQETIETALDSDADCVDCPQFYTDYDRGFVIRPYDKQATPFELKVNGRMQFRYNGFHRDISVFNNLGGAVFNNMRGRFPVENRNDFEIERARLTFSGFFFDPKLQFLLKFDGDTDDNHRAVFHDFWINYIVNDAFNIHVGKAFVPGSREWLNGSTATHLIDRSQTTTFFRPDRSIGVWATGEMSEGLFYRAMLGNGARTSDLERTEFLIDDQLFHSASLWWEPLGEFGNSCADLQWHECPVIRVGNSFSYGEVEPMADRITLEQAAAARLSDGSLLTAVGINDFDLYLYAVDIAAKYAGWSMNAEFYFRWLEDLKSGGAFAHNDLYQDGFTLDVGYMLLDKKLELVGRAGLIDGLFKDSWEYAGGINWFLNGTHEHKVSFDVSVLDGSPTRNASPGYEIGMDGVFFRMQYQAAF